MKKYIALLWLCCLTVGIRAAVQIKAAAPDVVEEGEQFRLSFTVNTQDVSNFHLPTLKGFSVDMGPSRSSQSSFQMINGKTSQSSSVTYTYILSALKAGTYTIPAATATVNGKQYRSNTVSIEVVPGSGGGSQSRQQGGGQHERMQMQDAGAKITGKDLFITVTADKQRLYEQEAVVLTYKVYSLVNLSQLAGGMPDLEGFHTQEIELPQQKSLKMEEHNGRRYGTVVWRQYVLFPQRSGKMTIPSIKFEGIVVQQNRNIDPIDAFFNGGSTMVEVKKTIVAPSLTLQVDPLPSPRPAGFSGAVGKFNISASLTPSEVKTNDALTLRVTVSGSGNMKLMKRTTDPQTIYITDSMHRDDIIDITDFDVVEYQYGVMRQTLLEEVATAILIGDGRDEADEHKISEEHVRSIWNDDDLYTIHYDVDIEAVRNELQGTGTASRFGENYIYAEAIITAALYSREKFKGTGTPDFFCTPHLVNVMLLARDTNGRRIYNSKADLAAALNINELHTAEQFEGLARTDKTGKKHNLLGIFVNLSDYTVGSTKGGEITRFNQFDIDFNQEKYLIETRLSGALTRLWSAIALEEPVKASSGQTEDAGHDGI